MTIISINSRRIVWFVLLVLLSQQSLAAAHSLLMAQVGEQHVISVGAASCQHDSLDHAHHFHDSQIKPGQHCERLSDSLPVHDHSHHTNHCEHCVSGCHSLLSFCLELHAVDFRSVDKSFHYLSFIPSEPIAHLFRPPISA